MKVEEQYKAQMLEESGRNKERLDVEKQRLENDKNLAVIQAKNEAMEQEQQLRDRIAKLQKQIDDMQQEREKMIRNQKEELEKAQAQAKASDSSSEEEN